MAEQALVRGDTDSRALYLPASGLTAQLPGQLADLRDCLGRDGLPEAGQPAGRVDRDLAAERGRAAAQQRLGLTLRAQPQVLVPVEFQRGGQVVHLGQAHVFGSDAGFGVGRVEDLVLEDPLRSRYHSSGIRCNIR